MVTFLSCLTTQGTCAVCYLRQPPSLTESKNTKLGPICPPTDEHRCAVDFRGDWQTVKAVRNSTCCLCPSSPFCPAPSPKSFRKRPREHPEADLQKASPTIWEGRGSGVQLGPFDLSSYIEPGIEAVVLNRDRQQVGMWRMATPEPLHLPPSSWNTSPGVLSPAAFSPLLRCIAEA